MHGFILDQISLAGNWAFTRMQGCWWDGGLLVGCRDAVAKRHWWQTQECSTTFSNTAQLHQQAVSRSKLSIDSLKHHQFPSRGSWSHTTLLISTGSHEFTLRKNPARGWRPNHPQGNHRKIGISKMHPFLPQHSTFGRCQKHSKTEKLFQKLVLMIRGSKTQASIFAMLERLPQGQHVVWPQQRAALGRRISGGRGWQGTQHFNLGSNLGFDPNC